VTSLAAWGGADAVDRAGSVTIYAAARDMAIAPGSEPADSTRRSRSRFVDPYQPGSVQPL